MALENQSIGNGRTLARMVHRVEIFLCEFRATTVGLHAIVCSLSEQFLSTKAACLLLLADTDRLDVDLTRGQMQGKFQLTLVPNVGHSLMEDAPMAVARYIHEFALRQCTPNATLIAANARLADKP
jgi:pimeloyl-ACP methyl ester carboxylesterase